MTDALARCTGDVNAFVVDRWGVSPFHRQGKPGDFGDLLSLDDVDHIIATNAPRRPAIRLVKDGIPVSPARYTRTARISGERVDGLVDAGRVYDLLGEGTTVVLQSLQRSWAPLAHFCRDLELALTHPVQANAYLTPAGAAGLAAHHDTHDVFVLQIHGRKRWMIHEPVVQAPLDHQLVTADEAGRQPVLFEAELQPGDVLYLPRGFVHAAHAQDQTSLHITVGILAYTIVDVLHELVRRAGESDPSFRQSLPVGFVHDPQALLEVVGACTAALHSPGAGHDAAAVESLTSRFWTGRRPLLGGQLRQLVELDTIRDTTAVEPRRGSAWRLEEQRDDLLLLLADRRVVFPIELGAAMHRILNQAPLAVGDLADLLDQSSRLVLVRRLVREGALVALGRG